MDHDLFNFIRKDLPKMNPLVANGLAVEQMTIVEEYIDAVWKCAAQSFPEGLKYEGCTRCTPKEEYLEITKKGSRSKKTYNLARSDVYMVMYKFSYMGKMLRPRPAYLPYVGKGGSIHINGTRLFISPVLADKTFSVDKGNVFIPLTRDKVTFERVNHNFYRNGQRESIGIVWSSLYHLTPERRKQLDSERVGAGVKAESTLAHYLFAKYGVSETFRKYLGCEIHAGEGEIDHSKYPEDEWYICQSTGIRPRRSVSSYGYQPSQLRVAIRKKDYSFLAASLIGGIFYVADRYPERVIGEYLDSTRLWRILLGKVIFNSGASEGKLADDVDTHIRSLDDYLDNLVARMLEADNIHCESIYDLFIHVIENLADMVMHTDVSDMYSKRFTTLRYVLIDIVKNIFKLTFTLRQLEEKGLTEASIDAAINARFKLEAVMGINLGHGEVTTIDVAGDNMLLRVTSNVVMQSDATDRRDGKAKLNLNDPSRFLHASMAEVASYVNQPKSDPTGRSKINPYVNVDASGTIHRKEKFRELLDDLQTRIAR